MLRISTCLLLLTALIGQPSAQQNIEEFGRKYFKSLQQNDLDLFLSLGYRAGEIIKTIDLKTESEEVRQSIKSELKENFDIKVRNEMTEAFEKLQSGDDNLQVDWSESVYVKFDFVQNERRTQKAGIPWGGGYLTFRYDGNLNRLAVDKMSKLLAGWRGNEFSAYIEPVNEN